MINVCCSSPLRTRQDNADIIVKECPDCGTIIKQRKRQPEGKWQVIFYIEVKKGTKETDIIKELESWAAFNEQKGMPLFKEGNITRFRIKKSSHN